MRGIHWRLAAGFAAATLVAGCSADSSDTADPPDSAVSSGAAELTPVASAPPQRKSAPAAPPTTVDPPLTSPPSTAPDPVLSVAVDVEIGPTSTVVAGDAAVSSELVDPFGPFAACSGLRDSVGNWSLQVSDPGQDVTAVSILTAAEVAGPGTFDGSFRVEFVNGAALDGTGTVTLDPGLQSGTFAATDADLRGEFSCTGAPAPQLAGASGVEVFALVRRGPSERMISLTEPYAPGATECSGPAGEMRVTGDAGVGAPIELAIDDGVLAIAVDGTALALDPARMHVQTDGTSGTFHAATGGGLEIDGAFSCA